MTQSQWEPGLDRHEWESRFQQLEDELDSAPREALPELRDLVEQMLVESGYDVDDAVAREGEEREIVSEFQAASETALLPALRELGYEVAHRSTLSSDTATSQAQIPLEVQRMQSAGVDTIFFAGYFVYVSVETYLYQTMENRALDQILSRAPAEPAACPPRMPVRTVARPPRWV